MSNLPKDEDGLIRHLKALPKVELHLHLEGSLRPDLLMHLASRNRLRIPFSHPDEITSIYRFKDFRGFANALLFGVACLRKPDDFHDAVDALGAQLADENIRYAEVTWTPQFYLNRGYSLYDFLDAMNTARYAWQEKTGLLLRWIPDIVRSRPRPAQQIARWASSAKARKGGVVALGLGGPEPGFPAHKFQQIFEFVRDCNLPANPHAGETDGPDSIWDTIKTLKPKRIGHGVRAIEDSALLEFLSREAIPLEISMTSNVRLGVFPSYEKHPVKRLIDAGCKVTLNTDDPVLFCTNLTDEYRKAITYTHLTLRDIYYANLNAIQAGYLGDDLKEKMMAEFHVSYNNNALSG